MIPDGWFVGSGSYKVGWFASFDETHARQTDTHDQCMITAAMERAVMVTTVV